MNHPWIRYVAVYLRFYPIQRRNHSGVIFAVAFYKVVKARQVSVDPRRRERDQLLRRDLIDRGEDEHHHKNGRGRSREKRSD